MGKLPRSQNPNLLVGVNTADDAGVFKISEDTALIQTVDFFTPIVDDPYTYGQIAAANSLSDVYAMGGRPITAMNVVAFSPNIFSADVLVEILSGGFSKVEEAGAVTVGGHTATDDELKYGLSVTGICHPDKIITNANAKPGDRLILTKPLGTGIISTALKNGQDLGALTDRVCRVMATLNKTASEAMQAVGVNACTDITGFGLLGHTFEMISGSGVGALIYSDSVPVFEEAKPLIEKGFVPGGTKSNGVFLKDKVSFDSSVSETMRTLFFDAQTSGGLLISVPKGKTDQLTEKMKQDGVGIVAVIGEITEKNKGHIEVSA